MNNPAKKTKTQKKKKNKKCKRKERESLKRFEIAKMLAKFAAH